MALGFAMKDDPQLARREALSAAGAGRHGGMGFDMAANDPEAVAAAAQVMRKAGRHEDDELAHVAENEIIVPIRLQQARPDLVAAIRNAFVDAGMDPDRYVVADTDGPRNPDTDAEEFFDAGAGDGGNADSSDGPNGGSPAGDGGGPAGGNVGQDTDGSPAGDGSGVMGGGSFGAEGVGPGPGTGKGGSTTVDDVIETAVRAFTRASLYDTAQKAFSGINQRARDAGISVTDGTGYSGPPGSPEGPAFGGGDEGNDVGGANDYARPPAAMRRSTADQPSTLPASATEPAGGFGFDTPPRVNPKTGVQQFASQSNFDRDFYLAQNPDVAAAGVDPWQHYQQHGQNEGRVATSEEAAARTEGYTGLFGKPESGQTYVDWKNAQATTQPVVTPSPVPVDDSQTVTVTPSPVPVDDSQPDAGPNNALNDYLSSQLGINREMFDGQGGFWAEVDRQGLPRHFIDSLISGFTQNFDPRTGVALRPEASGFYNGSALAPHGIYTTGGVTTGGIGDTPGVTGDDGIITTPDIGSTSVADRVDALLAADSPLMQRARTTGLQTANRRGLLNSSIAAQAAQNAMIDAAVPIASQDANISNQQLMQSRDIKLQQWLQMQDADLRKALQQGDLGNQRWIAELDATTRRQIADLQVATADREKIGAMIAAAQQNYTSQYEAILNNPNIPAERRAAEMAHIGNIMQAAISFIEQSYGVDLTWDVSTNTVSGG